MTTTPTCSPRCARSSDVTSPKDGCSPSGQCGCCTVLSTARPGRQLPDRRSPRSRASAITTLEGVDRPTSAIATPSAFAATRRAAVRLLHARASSCGPKALLDKKGADLDRDDAARHLGAHLCRCTGYVKILDAIELLAQGRDARRPSRPAASASSGIAYEGLELALGDQRYVDDIARRRACSTPRCASPTTPGPTSSASTRRPRPRRPASCAVFTAADVPGELRVGHHPQGLAGLHPRGRAHVATSATCSPSSWPTTAQTAPAPRPSSSTSSTTCCAPITDPVAAHRRRRDRGVGHSTATCCRASDVRAAATSTPRSPASAHVVHEVFQTQRIEHAFLEPESTLAVPAAPTARCTCTPAARACGTTATRSRRCSASTRERVTVELVSNGGAFGGKEDMAQPGADGAGGVAPAAAGEVHAVARGVAAASTPSATRSAWSTRAGCDADGTLTALRARMVGDSGPVRRRSA